MIFQVAHMLKVLKLDALLWTMMCTFGITLLSKGMVGAHVLSLMVEGFRRAHMEFYD